MKKIKNFSKKTFAIVLGLSVLCAAFSYCGWAFMGTSRAAGNINIAVDGSSADWDAVDAVYNGDGAGIASWKACYDDNNLYLLVNQNPLEGYGESIGSTCFTLTYNDSQYYNGNYGAIYCYQNWDNNGAYSMFDSWYTLIGGASLVFENGITDYNQDAAFAEICIPRSWFPSENFTISYCGTAVNSTDLTCAGNTVMNAAETEASGVGDGNSSSVKESASDRQDDAEADKKAEDNSKANDDANEGADTDEASKASVQAQGSAPVYSGIKIDGNASDWEALERVQNPCREILETSCVWDGDFVYIYFREAPYWDGILTQASPYANGNFCIETQNGSKTSVFVHPWYCYVNGMGDVEYAYKNHVYEAKIPTSYLRGFSETKTTSLNFGIMTDNTPIYFMTNIVNRTPKFDENDEVAGKLGEIKYDYDYSDWEGYSMTTVQYSNSGAGATDADGALYSDGDLLYGYANYTSPYYTDAFNYIYLCANNNLGESDKKCIKLTLRAVDAAGYVWHGYQAECLAPGRYEFYIFDNAYVGAVDNIRWKPDSEFCYGKAYITVYGDRCGNISGAEMEWYVDIPKIVKVVNIKPQNWGVYNWKIDQSDIKTWHIRYKRIGNQWISCGGTSTGPIIGLILCIGVVVSAYFIGKKKKLKA